MTDRCRTCAHQRHKHRADSACHTIDVTGPPSDKGKPAGDGYDDVGRDVTPCDCARFIPMLEVAG